MAIFRRTMNALIEYSLEKLPRLQIWGFWKDSEEYEGPLRMKTFKEANS